MLKKSILIIFILIFLGIPLISSEVQVGSVEDTLLGVDVILPPVPDSNSTTNGTTYHNLLANLEWSVAGHTFDTDVDFNSQNIVDVANISNTGTQYIDGQTGINLRTGASPTNAITISSAQAVTFPKKTTHTLGFSTPSLIQSTIGNLGLLSWFDGFNYIDNTNGGIKFRGPSAVVLFYSYYLNGTHFNPSQSTYQDFAVSSLNIYELLHVDSSADTFTIDGTTYQTAGSFNFQAPNGFNISGSDLFLDSARDIQLSDGSEIVGGLNSSITIGNLSVLGNASIVGNSSFVDANVTGNFILNQNSSAFSCGASTEGQIYYDGTNKLFYGCNSTTWIQIS